MSNSDSLQPGDFIRILAVDHQEDGCFYPNDVGRLCFLGSCRGGWWVDFNDMGNNFIIEDGLHFVCLPQSTRNGQECGTIFVKLDINGPEDL